VACELDCKKEISVRTPKAIASLKALEKYEGVNQSTHRLNYDELRQRYLAVSCMHVKHGFRERNPKDTGI